MSKRVEIVGYIVTFCALAGFFVAWKILVGREQPEQSREYQKHLETTAENILEPTDSSGDALRIYGVNVVFTRPFKGPFIGYGIYLGQGIILTTAQVVGHYPFYTNPRVLIGGQTLPAKIIRRGSPEHIDLALLSVNQQLLPISLRLRRNPFCKGPLQVGTKVDIVYPKRAVRSQIISPLLIASQFRAKFNTLVNEAAEPGSGVFNADKKCFLGVMSRSIEKLSYQNRGPFKVLKSNGFAGYFVPVSVLTRLTPQELHF